MDVISFAKATANAAAISNVQDDVSVLNNYTGKPTSTNLFKGYSRNFLVDPTLGIYPNSTATTRGAIIPIQYGKTYTVSVANGGNRFRIAVSTALFNYQSYPGDVISSTPSFGKPSCTILSNNDTLKTYTFTSTLTGYLYVYVSSESAEPAMTVTSPDHVIENTLLKRGALVGNFGAFYKSATCDNVSAGQTFDLGASSAATLRTQWEALRTANTSIIKKTNLGYASLANGTADNANPIDEYQIGVHEEPTCPVVLILGGLHGYEKSTPWTLLQFFTQLIAGWRTSEPLRALYSNVLFKVIPLSNPYGFTNNVRYNARDVDLNRNFGYKWTESTDEHKGASAYSELETQIIRDWIARNKTATLYIDFHNTSEATSQETYLVSPNQNLLSVYSSLSRVLDDVWKADYPSSLFRHHDIFGSEMPASFLEAYHVNGIQLSGNLEISLNDNNVAYTAAVIEEGVDLIANYTLAALNYANITGQYNVLTN